MGGQLDVSVFKVLVALLVPAPPGVCDGDGMFHSPQLLALLPATELRQLCRALPAAELGRAGASWALTWAKGHEAEVL